MKMEIFPNSSPSDPKIQSLRWVGGKNGVNMFDYFGQRNCSSYSRKECVQNLDKLCERWRPIERIVNNRVENCIDFKPVLMDHLDLVS